MSDPSKFTLKRTFVSFMPADGSKPVVLGDAKVEVTTAIQLGDQVFSHTFDPTEEGAMEKATNELAGFVLGSLQDSV